MDRWLRIEVVTPADKAHEHDQIGEHYVIALEHPIARQILALCLTWLEGIHRGCATGHTQMILQLNDDHRDLVTRRERMRHFRQVK